MDIHLSSLIAANQYAFHALVVGLVIVSAVLVYVFGFKPPVEPPFDKLTNPHEERKPNGKKRKTKEKKPQSNGHVTGITETKKDIKKEVIKKDVDKSPNKEKKLEKKPALKENRDVKPVTPPADTKKKGKGKENVDVKNKKNKTADEKPKDFDDGEWEQAPSRKDKKNKKTALEEILPAKSDKKKEQKKKKEDAGEVKEEEPAAAVVAEPEPPVVPEPVKEPAAPLKNDSVAESEGEQGEEVAKPKRARKKKGGSGERVAEEKPAAAVEPAKPAPPPAKPTKEPPQPAPPAPKVEAAPEVQPPETSVVFDELGDTWKEARAPKKGGKKKSRKE